MSARIPRPKRGSSKHLQARSDKYTDAKFNEVTANLDSYLCTENMYREGKLCFKEYSVAHVQSFLLRRNGPPKFGLYSQIVDFAKAQGVPYHFVECWFDSYNHPDARIYMPTTKYKVYVSALQKTQQRILIDMEYTAEAFFPKHPKAFVGMEPSRLKELCDVQDATKFLVKYLRFMFYAELPNHISVRLYNDLIGLEDKVAVYYSYTEGDDWAHHTDGSPAYGAFWVLGEQCSNIMFMRKSESRNRLP